MIPKRPTLIAALAAFPLIAYGATPPSFDEVQAWWRAEHSEPIDVSGTKIGPEEIDSNGDPLEIRLASREVAYLYPVFINPRGRNDWMHTVMVRPALKEVREVAHPVMTDLEVHDLDGDGISEVVCTALGSGQGATIGVRSIVQFDDWTPVVLHRASFEDNAGANGMRTPKYSSRAVSWKFTKWDGIPVLVETVTAMQGRRNADPIVETYTNRYAFVGGRFVRYVHFIRSKQKPVATDAMP